MTLDIDVLGVQVSVNSCPVAWNDPSIFRMWQLDPIDGLRASARISANCGEPGWKFDSRGGLEVRFGDSLPSEKSTPIFPAALFAAEISRQRAGFFHTHAGGVVIGNSGILITGGSGAGKTVASLVLASNDGVKFAGGDRCQIMVRDGRVSLYRDWANMRLRSTSIASSRTLIGLSWAPRIDKWLVEPSGWNRKLVVHASELGVSRLRDVAEISEIYEVRIMQDADRVDVEQIGRQDAVYAMSTALNDISTGFLVILDDKDRPLLTPFYDTLQETALRRTELLRAVVDVPRFRITGSLKAVTDYIMATSA
ncbi:hypothetical protein [Mycobacterium sp. 3519A]|uniref:hypothetical protein n=1 Tax=Mycobacterium sp. 3519A TaxID=2057184 RepID=UPI00135CCDF3|nr:hypothetical protein [Mycobacterium sp. 3519A]